MKKYNKKQCMLKINKTASFCHFHEKKTSARKIVPPKTCLFLELKLYTSPKIRDTRALKSGIP